MTLNDSRDIDLVNNLLATGHETEWLEFKHDQGEGKVIGKLCSALSNGARIHGKEKGYCPRGIDDKTCKVVGTNLILIPKNVAAKISSFGLKVILSQIALVLDSGKSIILKDAKLSWQDCWSRN